MATHVVTATTTSPVLAGNQISLYGQPTPISSADTTANNSPASPQQQYLPLHSKQLRPLKGPLYVPAALRPNNDHATQKASPPSPPRSVHGSLDSLTEGEIGVPATRRSTMESYSSGSTVSKLAEDEWMKKEDLGEVTGQPTREHWKADSASPNCDSPTCRSSFGIFLRRHHCRHCGHVFCSSHTPYVVPLDQNARFHPEGVPSRACDLCWSAYSRWEESRTERLNKIQTQLDAQTGTVGEADRAVSLATKPSPVESLKAAALNGVPGQSTEIAASVPRGWNWSTF
ncbi:putative FYVE domain protein [Aspergillus japonicus CBS 114.51]|uniref:Putative FYVE domain protein n=2 Tax=Aspergillus subgen. Circumdati TaxID=2720871 RepID=A0A2V5I8Y9_9EURO|nr:putative FYVE domain protein [Aspergillus japonicus CBS 114.51]PYI24960.1 putative FYVE domain protein [Aspergillus indologenus CBS 114.80]RAH79808.1 putative FYVE domain protein [Aspergillus japonicus CBS 114.51]